MCVGEFLEKRRVKGHFKMNHSLKSFNPTPYNTSKKVSGTSESNPHENGLVEQTIVM